MHLGSNLEPHLDPMFVVMAKSFGRGVAVLLLRIEAGKSCEVHARWKGKPKAGALMTNSVDSKSSGPDTPEPIA